METSGYAFISYSSKNYIEAETMRAILNESGIKTWMAPGDIPVGKKYAQVINRAIKNCSCFVLILSDEAQSSVWVPKEIDRAVHYKKPIFPVKIKETSLNDEFEFYLSTDQLVLIKKLEKSNEILKKMLASISACVHESAACNISKDENKNEDKEEEKNKAQILDCKSDVVDSADFANYFYFHINFSDTGGSLLVVSPESRSGKILKAEITEQIWSEFVKLVKQLLSTALGIDTDEVSVKRYADCPLGTYECAPAGSLSYDKVKNEIYFSCACLGSNSHFIHNGVVFQVYERQFEVCFFKDEDFAFKFMPKYSTFSDFGVDESKMYELGTQLISFAMQKKDLHIAKQKQKRVYDDYSGGFYINFIDKE